MFRNAKTRKTRSERSRLVERHLNCSRTLSRMIDIASLVFHAWQSSCLTVRFVCLLFVSPPPAQVEARRSVTAGHGMITAGRPVLGHGRSRRRGSGLSSHNAGPSARASAARHAGVAFSRKLACATEVAVHLSGTCRQARLNRPSLSRGGRLRSRRWSCTGRVAGHVPVASLITCLARP
jgi:hypothetical protein